MPCNVSIIPPEITSIGFVGRVHQSIIGCPKRMAVYVPDNDEQPSCAAQETSGTRPTKYARYAKSPNTLIMPTDDMTGVRE